MSATEQVDDEPANVEESVEVGNSGTPLIDTAIPKIHNVVDSTSKLDELISLEREIAEMHHIAEEFNSVKAENTNGGTTNDNTATDDSNRDLAGVEMLHRKQDGTATIQAAVNGNVINEIGGIVKEEDNAIEHEDDLIAVLKGIENGESETSGNQESVADSNLSQVTIEGEGQFQIMEVVDDESEEPTKEGSVSEQPAANASTSPVSLQKSFSTSTVKLTPEEVRAVALEQMAGLKSRVERQRRRKQDIKNLQLESTEPVVSAGIESKKDDITAKGGKKQLKTDSAKSGITIKLIKKPSSNIQCEDSGIAKTMEDLPDDDSDQTLRKSPKDGAVNQNDNTDNLPSDAVGGNDEAIEDSESPSLKMERGFKRTRVIKRKIIWDPDAPETQYSYSRLVRNAKNESGDSPKKLLSPSTPKSKGSIKPTGSSPLTSAKKLRPTTPKEKRTTQSLVAEANTKTLGAPKSTAASAVSSEDDSNTAATVKRRSPLVAGLSVPNKKKKVTEIDRLMGDEGAVNMLNSLETERKKEIEENSEKPHKHLMRNRTATTVEKQTPKRDAIPAAAKKDSPPAVKARRSAKAKPSATWDYIYKKQVSDDSMIIRRRSNSSYSSTTSPRRLSVDGPSTSTRASAAATSARSNSQPKSPANATTATGRKSQAKTAQSKVQTSASPTENAFEFAKPESKGNQKRNYNYVKPVPGGNKRGGRSPVVPDDKEKLPREDFSNADLSVKRIFRVAQVSFSTQHAHIAFTFTGKLLNDLTTALEELRDDPDCDAVVFVTQAPNFCHGVDYSEMSVHGYDDRRVTSNEMARIVKNYLKALAAFPKPLIVGVNGSNIGLGVTQLLLFDIVIASEKATFETPYAKQGHLPEGHCIWNTPTTKIVGSVKPKLFWLGDKIHANEAAISGLVTKLTTSSKVNEDALNAALKIAAMPQQTYRLFKTPNIPDFTELLTQLDTEFDIIAEQWNSIHCIDSFSRLAVARHY